VTGSASHPEPAAVAPPSGEPPLRVDLHTHMLPPELPDMHERTGYGAWIRLEHTTPGRARMLQDERLFREIGSDCWDAPVRLAAMDRLGVDVQVLSTVPVMFAYWARPRDTLLLARVLNDHLTDVVAAHPRRFVALGTVPLQAPDLAIEELERCVGDLGMPGVQIGSHVGPWNLDAPELFPFFQAAADLGAAVFVHPWDMLAPERMERYWMPWLVGMPTESTIAICSVIFGGLLERLPALRIGFAHGGGSFAGTFGRIARGFAVRPDLVAVANPVEPAAYLGRFWVDTLVHDPAVLRTIVDLVGADRVALGTDYPFPLGEQRPGETIEAVRGLSPDQRAALYARAALAFLNRSEGDFAR
jgi:aminocarboxymuconate-semialdehyde decarboxylase